MLFAKQSRSYRPRYRLQVRNTHAEVSPNITAHQKPVHMLSVYISNVIYELINISLILQRCQSTLSGEIQSEEVWS